MKRSIETDLNYCPNCHDEYRADITTCAVCSIALISGEEMLAAQQQNQERRNMILHPDDEMVTIRKGPVIQMKDFQVMLKREGFPSLAVSEDSSCSQKSCGTNLLVQIRKSDLQDVMAVLERDHIRSTGLEEHDLSMAGAVFDTDAEQATCPACGHTFPTTETSCPECGLCFA